MRRAQCAWTAMLLLALGSCTAESIAPTKVRGRVRVGTVPLAIRIARTPEARRRGLQGVRALAPDEGMLFVYAEDAPRRFWMQGCCVALDIAFLDAGGVVLQVETLQPPGRVGEAPARTRRSPPARYALETRAGFFEDHGLGVGTHVQLPAEVLELEALP